MAAFEYEALLASGKKETGVMEGDSAKQVRQELRELGKLPVSVTQASGTTDAGSSLSALERYFNRLSAFDLALFMRQLSVLLASGSPLEEALLAVAKQTPKKRVKTTVLAARSKVLEGYTLANALNAAASFPQLVIATIRAGEQSGALDSVLLRLADYLESRFRMQRKVQGALVYPVLLLILSVSVVVGLMTYVVPKIVAVFERSEQALPAVTQVVMGFSNLLVAHGVGIFLMLLVLLALSIKFFSTDKGARLKHRVQLKLPFFGKLYKGLDASRVTSTLAILVGSGVPLVEALQIASKVASNCYIQEAVEQAAVKVSEGSALSPQLERSGYFPPMMIQMIRSGEQSGELETMLVRTASLQEQEASDSISVMLSLLEPLMLVFMGVLVFVIVLAVMLPIVSLNNLAG